MTSNAQSVHTGIDVNSSGTVALVSYDERDIFLAVNVVAAPTGTSPQIVYKIQEVDPSDRTTPLGPAVSTPPITGIGETEIVLSNTKGDTILVTWTVTGTNADFSNISAILWQKAGARLAGLDAQLALGYVSSLSLTGGTTAVRATTYNEQTANAQRSLVSSNANDTSAGTGARKVKVTYLDQTGAGPYTEIVTMSGTTPVNMTATNVCFVERMDVDKAGSGGKNAGIITLKTGTGGTGTEIGSIAVGDNETFWAHHYTPAGGLSTYITGTSVAHTGIDLTTGATFIIKSKPINLTDAVERQVSDFMRLIGNESGLARAYATPIKILGPARSTMYATSEALAATTYRGSFDFYDA
jgi:hypothetical protein